MILLFDGDGVAMKKFPYFSETYSKRHNVSLEKFQEFFSGPFQLCQKGEGDLKKGITPYLESWNWDKSADDFLEYWFTTDVVAETKVLSIIKKLKDAGHKTYLASEQEEYRKAWIEKTLNTDEYFTGTFFTCDVGFMKAEKEFYASIINTLNEDPKNIHYWDDLIENITIAKSLGINSYLFKDQEQFEEEIETIKK